MLMYYPDGLVCIFLSICYNITTLLGDGYLFCSITGVGIGIDLLLSCTVLFLMLRLGLLTIIVLLFGIDIMGVIIY